ncbi:hypothetical protein BaRGS_00036648 [Batillaria attramentaria]|uniref:Uncharacterized protein n=1 Tax=Batillaria attramentaria TaxID=370345 RepID=A0ABD0JBF8_9CAEN
MSDRSSIKLDKHAGPHTATTGKGESKLGILGREQNVNAALTTGMTAWRPEKLLPPSLTTADQYAAQKRQCYKRIFKTDHSMEEGQRKPEGSLKLRAIANAENERRSWHNATPQGHKGLASCVTNRGMEDIGEESLVISDLI